MKVCGIVCEYNPFHNGHSYHIKQTKLKTNSALIVCAMSGNYVQRGEASIIDKWERATAAIKNGADLVVEIPYIYCMQSANYYAKGAIDVLKQLQIDTLSFGSETCDLDTLYTLARQDINLQKQQGISTSKAYEEAYGKLEANDILGLNYIKNILDTSITPCLIKRTNDYHDITLQDSISSATSIRNAIYEDKDVSQFTSMKLDNSHHMKYYYPYIRTLLLTLDTSYLRDIFLMDEGLEGLLKKSAREHIHYEDFIHACTSKRYTKSSIQRTIIHLLNQVKKQDKVLLEDNMYIRVLAYNDKGKEYLKQVKKDIHIVSKFNQLPKVIQELENKLIDTYVLPLSEQDKVTIKQKEFQPPIYIKNL